MLRRSPLARILQESSVITFRMVYVVRAAGRAYAGPVTVRLSSLHADDSRSAVVRVALGAAAYVVYLLSIVGHEVSFGGLLRVVMLSLCCLF